MKSTSIKLFFEKAFESNVVPFVNLMFLAGLIIPTNCGPESNIGSDRIYWMMVMGCSVVFLFPNSCPEIKPFTIFSWTAWGMLLGLFFWFIQLLLFYSMILSLPAIYSQEMWGLIATKKAAMVAATFLVFLGFFRVWKQVLLSLFRIKAGV